MVFLPLFVGWKIMDWWESREKRLYAIDWKAAIIGPIVLLILSFIPVIGWLIDFLLFLWMLGGIIHYVPSIADVPARTVAPTTPTTVRKPARRRK